MDPGPADVVRARTQLGNAAVTAAMGGLPPGAEPSPSGWQAQMLLAGQNLVGNQAIANQAAAPPTPVGPAGLAPVPPTPVKPTPKTPPPAKPTAQKTEAPAASAPDKKDLGKDKAPEERPEKGAKKEKAGPRSPGADPKFQALKKDVNTKKKTIGASHPPAAAEAGAAQEAAEAPADDQEARGKAAHAEDMDAAKPKEFNKQEFIQAVKKAIAAKAPKNLDEADKFSESGKAEEVKAEVQGKVGEGKDASAQEIAETTAAPPEPAPDAKQVVPMAADKAPGKPGTPNPAQATPDQLPPSATDMSAGPDQVNQQMAEAKVTEKQLTFKNSREPQFDKAVKEKKSMEAHSEAAPNKLRADESRELNQVKKTAATQGSAAMAGIHATRVTTGQQVGTGKQGTKKTDEDKRKEVTALLQKVFDQTKCDVEKILEDLDKKVDDQFTTKEKRARDRFTREHEEGMERYKDERYGGLTGKARWVRDLFAGLPEEANRIYERARDNYLAAMDQIITEIADTVEAELKRAKDRIAAGRKELKAAVDKLPADLRAIGREAATEFEGKFDELKDTVNEKGTELVDTLATKYTDAVKAVDEEIAAEKEKNKGLVAKAADAIGGAIKAILELGRMLMGVLRKAVSAIGAILKDPIGFLGNLVKGVGGGLKLFMKNAGRHLQGGVLAWLLGTGGAMGLQLPRTFDILGILTLIAMLLGLSWPNIRARLARRVPRQALTAAETGVPVVSQVKRRGVAGMWDDLKTRVGDLKKELISNLVKFLLPTIIIAGITWIVSLFNPASAFIRACKMIIDIIRFIVTNARQIIDFVNAVLDAVLAIARGGTGGVPALVERALARSIPVLIGALAALLGIGGIAGKVKQIFQKLARPVNRAIDWVIDKMVGLIKKLWAKIKPKRARKRRPDKRKSDRAARRRRGPRRPRRPDSRRRRPRRDRRRPYRESRRRDRPALEKKRRLDAALREAEKLFDAGETPARIKAALPSIRARHKLTALQLVTARSGGRSMLRVKGRINPTDSTPEHPYGFEVQIHIYEHNLIRGPAILRQVRERYSEMFRETIETRQKKFVIIRMEAGPDAGWDWVARMEASAVSARQKVQIATALGFTPVHEVVPHDIPVDDLVRMIRRYNRDKTVTAIVVQLPLHPRYDRALAAVASKKDIDFIARRPRSQFQLPATSEGIVRVAEPFLGDKPIVAVVGAKGFVGRGVVSQLRRFDVRIIELDRVGNVDPDLSPVRNAAVVISVAGRAGLLTPALVLPSHRLVVDSSFVPQQEGGPMGDVDPEARPIPKQITPVPGGIGPVEMAVLAERLVRMEARLIRLEGGPAPRVPTWRVTDPEGQITM